MEAWTDADRMAGGRRGARRPAIQSVVRRLAHMMALVGLLLVWSEGVRAEYDPARCPTAQAAATAMINGLAPAAPALFGTDVEIVDIVCTSCCHSPCVSVAEVETVHDSDVVASSPEALFRPETPLLLHFESLRPPRI